jgi:lysophospholipase L1-like esterase
MKSLNRRVAILGAAMVLLLCQCVAFAQQASSRTEEIEWTWEVRPAHVDAKLPNVLLLGDSITRAYFPEVGRQLAGVANVYLMASSTSVGDPRLGRQIEEFSKAEGVTFSLVHFNNGMHGWAYSEQEYREAFPDFVSEIRTIAPKAVLIWATTTPVRKDTEKDSVTPGPTNARVIARNAIAEELVKPAGIAIDDQHELMLKHTELHQDNVHFNEDGAAIEGKQAAEMIRGLLLKAQR